MRRPRLPSWSNVLAIAYREAIALRHDQAFLGIVLAQPLVMLVLFGYALSNKPANVPWAVLDRSRTPASRRLLRDVQATGYFRTPRTAAGYDEGRRLLGAGRALAFVVVPHEFRRDLERGHAHVQLLLDGSDPLTAARIGGYVAEVAAGFDTAGRPARPPPGAPELPATIEVRQRFWFNHTLSDHDFFLVALAGMLLTNLCFSVTSLGLVGERESGTYEQMLALPTTPLEIVLGKVTPYVGVSYGVWFVATALSGLVFGVWPQGSWLALVLVTLPFVLASLAIGVLVSALARTSAQAVFISVFFILPSFVLSGSMFPYQLMPPVIRAVGGLLPLRWYQIALRRVVARGAGLVDIAVPMAALVALFAVLLGLIRWRMKPRLA